MQEVVIVEEVIPAVQEKDLVVDQGILVDEQVPHSEPAAERLMTYILNERWKIDEESRNKAMDVSFVILILFS